MLILAFVGFFFSFTRSFWPLTFENWGPHAHLCMLGFKAGLLLPLQEVATEILQLRNRMTLFFWWLIYRTMPIKTALESSKTEEPSKSTGRRTCNSCHFQIEVLWQVVCQKEIMVAPKCSLSLSHIHLRHSLRNSLSVGSWVTLRFLWGKKWLETKSSLPPGS